VLAALAAVAVATPLASASSAPPTGSTPARPSHPPPLASGSGQLVAAVGDIACAPADPSFRAGAGTPSGCQQRAVARLLAGQHLAAFLALGDLQYETGALSDFRQVYDRYFGRYKAITRPVPGNHEYSTAYGAGYYAYFGAAAHHDNPMGATGDYSFDIGSWHLIALSSVRCTRSRPCTPTSATMRWLAADLAAHHNRCTLAYWHHPLWSVGPHGSYAPMIPVWNYLYAKGVDLILNGHDHNYQRFAPLGPTRLRPGMPNHPLPPVVDRDRGIRMFILGTGGENNYELGKNADPAVAAAVEASAGNPAKGTFGVLFLRLHYGGYDYRFVQADVPKQQPFHDSGSGTCR
jgi:hypothetical protein